MPNRRQLLIAAAALLPASRLSAGESPAVESAASLLALRARVPDYRHFLTLNELRERTRRLRERYPALISVRVIGASRKGEPIELVTLGQGRRAALVVAGVHSNEVIGSNTVDCLMHLLADDARLRERLDHTWHFINPIEPDGMRLNESWLGRELTPASYFGGFFRPALRRQAEYTFPAQLPSLKFDAAGPENLAWRTALELMRPDFQFSLHNSEYGGAFFATSREFPELEQRLQRIPSAFDVSLSVIGEPLSELSARASGVFMMPNVAEMTGKAPLLDKPDDTAAARPAWPAGDSSAGYAQRYGTFSFIAELPYWHDARVFDEGPSEWSPTQVVRDFVGLAKQSGVILDRWAERVLALPGAEPEIAHSLREYLEGRDVQLGRLEAGIASGALGTRPLTVSQAANMLVSLRLINLRPVATLARLAEKSGDAHDEAVAFVRQQLGEIERETPLRAIPLRSLVGIQAMAALTVATMLPHERR